MKKFLLIIFFCFFVLVGCNNKNDGNNDNVYKISSISDLFNIKNNLNGNFELTQDLDLSGYSWEPIGDENNPFTGTFNGNGYSINNLTVSNRYRFVGLFGYAYNAKLSNVTFNNIKYTYVRTPLDDYSIINYYVGSLVGFAHNSKIDNIVVNSIDNQINLYSIGKYFLGGIVGECTSSCTISNSINYSNLTGMNIVGGIVGLVYASNHYSKFVVSNCKNYGNIRALSDEDYPEVNAYAGGIIGCITIDFEIKECENEGIISAFTVSGTVTQSYASNIIGRVYGEVTTQDIISCVENGEVYIEKGTHEHKFFEEYCYCGEAIS